MDISNKICYVILALFALAVILLTLFMLPPSDRSETLIDVYIYNNSIECSGKKQLYSTIERTRFFGDSTCFSASNNTTRIFHFEQICNDQSNILEQKNKCNSICSVCDSSETFMIVKLDPICLFSKTNDVSYGYEQRSSFSIRLPDCLQNNRLNG